MSARKMVPEWIADFGFAMGTGYGLWLGCEAPITDHWHRAIIDAMLVGGLLLGLWLMRVARRWLARRFGGASS